MSSFLEFNLEADHLTSERGYGWFCLCNNFFLKPPVIEFFPDLQRCKVLFPALYALKYIFFQCRDFFCQLFPCNNFFPQNQPAGFFFSEITHTPLNSQKVGPLCFINFIKAKLVSWLFLAPWVIHISSLYHLKKNMKSRGSACGGDRKRDWNLKNKKKRKTKRRKSLWRRQPR